MELATQKYLRNGGSPEELEEFLGIREWKCSEDLITKKLFGGSHVR